MSVPIRLKSINPLRCSHEENLDSPYEQTRLRGVMMAPKAYAYIRWSTGAQQLGDSESRQLLELDKFEKNTGIKIVKKYRDNGRSAYRGDNSRRGEFRLLLENIESGEIRPGDYLVVESIDRITRQRVLDGVELIQKILKSGVKLYTTTDQKIYSVEDPSEDLKTLLMISVIAQRANEESEVKSKRLSSSWAKRRQDAESGKIIIKKGKSVPYGLRVENGEFVIHEEEQKEIQRLFELLLTHGLNSAIKIINKNPGKKWNNGTINKIINNRTVIGYMPKHTVVYGEDGKGRKSQIGYIENYYPKIIEPALFYNAINAMKARKNEGYSGRRGEQDFNIFKNVIFCAKCGGKLYYDHRGSRYKGKMYPHFKCDNYRTNPDICTANNLRFEHVLGLTLSAFRNAEKVSQSISEIKSISEHPGELINSLSLLSGSASTKETEYSKKLQELGEKQIKLDNLTRQIKQADFNIPQLIMKQLSALEASVEKLKQEVERLAVEEISENIDLSSQASIMEKFMTEEGRGKLNSYFKNHGLTFHAEFDKSERVGALQIKYVRGGITRQVAEAKVKFPQKQILESYGLPSLQEMFDLTLD